MAPLAKLVLAATCSSHTTGLMCLAFHPDYPNLLAVGCYDGAVLIFDVRLRTGRPLYASTARSGKHTEPVWQVGGRTWVGLGGLGGATPPDTTSAYMDALGAEIAPHSLETAEQCGILWTTDSHRCPGSAPAATSCSSTPSPQTAGSRCGWSARTSSATRCVCSWRAELAGGVAARVQEF